MQPITHFYKNANIETAAALKKKKITEICSDLFSGVPLYCLLIQYIQYTLQGQKE